MKNIISGFNISPALFHLYLNRTIQLVGIGLVSLFLPIYLFEAFNNDYALLALFFIAINFISIFVMPIGAKIMTKIGLRRSMILASFFVIMYLFCYFIYDFFAWSFLLVLAIIFINFWRMLYWVPFHTEFATLSYKASRGKQTSIFQIITDILGILVPLVAGLILVYFSYPVLFFIAMVILLISTLPIWKIGSNPEKFSFSYWQTYHVLFKKSNRKMLIAYMADGAETMIGGVIWPVFIYLVLQGEYLAVGAVSTLIIGMTVILDLIIGYWADRLNKKKIIKYSSFFYSIGWIIKIFVQSAFQIFIVSTYHNLTAIFRRIPFDALMYEKAADRGHYVDEYTVLREISLNIGRLLMLLVIFFAVAVFDIVVVFVLAALVSFLINILE